LYEKGGAPFEVARTRLDLARVMERLHRTDAAVAEVNRAIEGLTRLGANLDISAAEAMRDRLAASPQPAASDAAARDTSGLTAREVEVLRLISSGLSNQAIAKKLYISEHTVHRHVANTLAKLEVSSRSAAVAQAARLGLL
jgi:DNA-binding NarL/FixJ family response regulator